MSGCEFYQELISRMLDEELSGEESAVLAEHLDSCEECRSVYSAFTALSASIAEDLVDAPESIKINVMTEVRRSELIKKNKKKSMKRLFATAACLVLVAGAAYMALPELADEDKVDEALADKESALAIHRILHGLDEPYKEVFSLRVFGELGFRQIGEIFGKSEHWACVTYHRAKEKIRKELSEA